MTVAISGTTRSIAVIGRKRSAQDSWDDACASYVTSGNEIPPTEVGGGSDPFYRSDGLEKDLIFNPKENTNAETVFAGRDRR